MLRWLTESLFGSTARHADPAASPGDAAALLGQGAALHREDRFAEAADAYRRALEIDPALPRVQEVLGGALAAQGDYAGALQALDAALLANPASVTTHCDRAIALLATGEYAEGWREFEWRWQRQDMQVLRGMFRQPWWDGSDIRGRTLLLFAEQGFGDAIQFARFLPLAAAATGARIALDCHPPLRALLGQVPGVAEVLASDEEIARYDLCFPLMSLPGRLGTTFESVPREVPYLHAPAPHVSLWKSRVAPAGTCLRVGLVWASNPGANFAWRKSIPLELLAPLAEVPGIELYSLQTDLPAEAASQVPGMKMADFATQLRDFSDTAALIENLDLVISVDTAVAHLAGALAKPVWTMLPHNPDWRWHGQGDQSRWYPTMRLFRQGSPQDWDSVARPVLAALRTLASRRTASAGAN